MDPGFFNHDKKESPQIHANYASLFTFWWLRELFTKGLQRQLNFDDMYRPLDSHISSRVSDKFERVWIEETKKQKPSLLNVIMKLYGKKILIISLTYSVVEVIFRISQPLCLGMLISYFTPGQTQISETDAYLYASGVVFSTLFNIAILHPFLLKILYYSMQMRLSCCSLIYRKLLRLNLRNSSDENDNVNGKIINLMTNDANRFDMCSIFLMEIWRAPLEGVIIIYLIYLNIGYSALIGVAFLLSFIPLQVWLSHVLAKYRRKFALKTDYRIKMMNEVIQGIQIIKMYAWEYCFSNFIKVARKKEMDILRIMASIKACMQACIQLNAKISIFLSIISYILLGNQVTAAKIFVLFSLYDLIRLSVVEFFPNSIMFAMDAYVSIQRIEEFLLMPEIGALSIKNGSNMKDQNILNYISDNSLNCNDKLQSNGLENSIKLSNQTLEKPFFEMKNVNAVWKLHLDDETVVEKSNVALQDISLNVSSCEFVAVIGQVGSGKSVLLNTIIKEVPIESGLLIINGNISYCSQTPWLFEASVRQNIVFDEQMDKFRYRQVIKCCQLESDFKMFPHGDKTIVGERGVSLSGGQRARVSLARCVYKNADIYLLDDPLSAVDSRVASALLNSCIRGFLKNKAVILVTHQVQHLQEADKICVMEAKKIVFQDTYERFKNSQYNSDDLFATVTEQKKNEQQGEIEEHHVIQRKTSISSANSLTSFTPDIEEEGQAVGSVDMDVYKAFFNCSGSLKTIILLIILFCVSQVMRSACDVWISKWVNMEELSNSTYTKLNLTSSNKSYEAFIEDNVNANDTNKDDESYSFWTPDSWNLAFLGYNPLFLSRSESVYIYSIILGINILFTLTKLIFFFNMCIQASINLHDKMFRGLSRATMWFFNNNASGRILNRFAKDIGTVDVMLPSALNDCLSFLLEIVAILIVVCTANFWLLIPTAFIVVFLLLIRYIYLSSSRSIKRLEGISRSPAFTHVNATFNGLDTIRSRGSQLLLIKEFDKHQDSYTSVWSMHLVVNRAFGLWMDIVCCVYLAIVTYSFISISANTYGGNVGLAVTQAIGLIGMCQWGMRQTAEVENYMTSVERIVEYTKLPSEPPLETDLKLFNSNYPGRDFDKWPEKGDLEIKNLYLTYDKSENKVPVLKNVNFKVKTGEKIGIVGRTGAGKSSLIAALFRLADLDGSILIDNVDTKSLGLHKLRSSLSIIPQEPMLFNGSLRDNLDPWGNYSDSQLWEALEEVELKNYVMTMAGGLNTKVVDGGLNFSSGQRQLLCLARAILKQSNILLLDEATANVDLETDKLIQITIRKKFSDKTVLTIAHRLHTVMDSDKVLVMDRGQVVEYGHPYELLTQTSVINTPSNVNEKLFPINEESMESLSFEDSPADVGKGAFILLLEQTGQATFNALFKIAEENYNKLEHSKKND